MRKNNLATYTSLSAGNMAGNLISDVTDIRWLDNIVVYLTFTGSPVGGFSVEVSPDQTNWYALAIVPTPTAVGISGNHRIELNQLSDPYIRVTYTRTTGTGSLTVVIAGKML